MLIVIIIMIITTMALMMAMIMITIIIIISKVYEFLVCEQEDKIDVKHVMERVKKEMNKKMEKIRKWSSW